MYQSQRTYIKADMKMAGMIMENPRLLLLKHIHIDGELPLRRKLMLSLLELEFELYTHALIEEKILLPLIEDAEKQGRNG